jgi:hypothetical protein
MVSLEIVTRLRAARRKDSQIGSQRTAPPPPYRARQNDLASHTYWSVTSAGLALSRSGGLTPGRQRYDEETLDHGVDLLPGTNRG